VVSAAAMTAANRMTAHAAMQRIAIPFLLLIQILQDRCIS